MKYVSKYGCSPPLQKSCTLPNNELVVKVLISAGFACYDLWTYRENSIGGDNSR